MQAIEGVIPQSVLQGGTGSTSGVGGDRGGFDGPEAQASLVRTRLEAAEQVWGGMFVEG